MSKTKQLFIESNGKRLCVGTIKVIELNDNLVRNLNDVTSLVVEKINLVIEEGDELNSK